MGINLQSLILFLCKLTQLYLEMSINKTPIFFILFESDSSYTDNQN